MRELIRRLTRRPFLCLELLLATFMVAALNLASPLFVIQVLNRYITFGFDGTLYTLTAGMLIAVVLLFGFSLVRSRLAMAVSLTSDRELADKAHEALAKVKAGALDAYTRAKARERMENVNMIQTAYEGGNIAAVLDAPFSMLFVLVAALLSPALALVGLAAMAVMLFLGGGSMYLASRPARELQRASMQQRGLVGGAIQGVDSMRAYDGGAFFRALWDKQLEKLAGLRRKLSENRGLYQSVTISVIVLSSVGIYAVGARQVVDGALTVGALIAVNILTARAVQNISRFAQAYSAMSRAGAASRELNEFLALEREPDKGREPQSFSGKAALRDVSFAYPGGAAGAGGPLFESLNLELEPGAVLAVHGYNGSGKTTLARLLVGLIEPDRGEVLLDGVNMRQLDPTWRRRHIMYMPQEPVFYAASMADNILAANRELDEAGLQEMVEAAGLAQFCNLSPEGLKTPVIDSGRNLSLGIRKRLALARALAGGGKFVVLDEPTEALDGEGRQTVYALLNRLVSEGRCLVVATGDPVILKGAGRALNLSIKPTPRLESLRPDQAGAGQGHAGQGVSGQGVAGQGVSGQGNAGQAGTGQNAGPSVVGAEASDASTADKKAKS